MMVQEVQDQQAADQSGRRFIAVSEGERHIIEGLQAIHKGLQSSYQEQQSIFKEQQRQTRYIKTIKHIAQFWFFLVLLSTILSCLFVLLNLAALGRLASLLVGQ